MAAEYTKFSLDDITRFVKRGWRAMRPRKGVGRSEVYIDLELSSKAFIRIWTSIYEGQTEVRSKKRRPMRVQLLAGRTLGDGRPLTRGKAPIVKRTQGWKNSLQNRIEDYIELFEEPSYYKYHDPDDGHDHDVAEVVVAPPLDKPVEQPEPEASKEPAGEPPAGDKPKKPRYAGPPVSDKQVKLLKSLITMASKAGDWDRFADEFDLSNPTDESEIREVLTGGWKGSASQLIDRLKNSGYWFKRRYADDDQTSYDRRPTVQLIQVEPGYWADAEAGLTIERVGSTSDQEVFRLADMQSTWRDEKKTFPEAVQALSEYAGHPFSV